MTIKSAISLLGVILTSGIVLYFCYHEEQKAKVVKEEPTGLHKLENADSLMKVEYSQIP